MYQISENCDAPAATNENFNRKAEVTTIEQTKKLEHNESLAGATASGEILEKVQKQPPAATCLKGPLDATQNTSDAEVGLCHVEELVPMPESQVLAACVQRSPERRCVQSAKAHAWTLVSAGTSTARGSNGDSNFGETDVPEAEAPREPQTHPKRKHLLATWCTPAALDGVARIKSSQAAPADGSTSAATTSANGQGVEAGLRAMWNEIEPAAIHSASVARLLTIQVAANPVATSDKVRIVLAFSVPLKSRSFPSMLTISNCLNLNTRRFRF